MKILYTSILVFFSLFLNGQTVIKMEKQGQLFKIPCLLNGLPLNFLFDTGASDVTISIVEAAFMLKNGYLSEQDIEGSTIYQIANGDFVEGTKIKIREIEIGGYKLYNIVASVIHTSDAPLLLGQSALQRLGKIQIDYATNTLTITNSMTTNNSSNEYRYSTSQIQRQKRIPPYTALDTISKFRTGKAIAPKTYIEINHKKKEVNDVHVLEYINDSTTTNLISIEDGDIYIIAGNVIRVRDEIMVEVNGYSYPAIGYHYLYYVHYNGTNGFLSNTSLEDF